MKNAMEGLWELLELYKCNEPIEFVLKQFIKNQLVYNLLVLNGISELEREVVPNLMPDAEAVRAELTEILNQIGG